MRAIYQIYQLHFPSASKMTKFCFVKTLLVPLRWRVSQIDGEEFGVNTDWTEHERIFSVHRIRDTLMCKGG